MAVRRPYPEEHLTQHHRAPRLVELADGRRLVLSEPGWEEDDRVILHEVAAAAAIEGLPEGTCLLGPDGTIGPLGQGAAAGIALDDHGRLLLACSAGGRLCLHRTRLAFADTASAAWEALPCPLPEEQAWELGSLGVVDGRIVLALLGLPTGAIRLIALGDDGWHEAVVEANPQNRTPTFDAAGGSLHVVWDTEALRIRYRRVELSQLLAGTVPDQPPVQVWHGCHHPDVAARGEQVIVAYSDHMQYIKYCWFDGREWHRDLHLTTLNPRFQETIEHSPAFWRDAVGRLHLGFACPTRGYVYDAAWLGEGFSDPQPVEGLVHSSRFYDEIRVKIERLTVDRATGHLAASSSFMPEQHGLYAPTAPLGDWRPGEPLLFLDLAEAADCRGFQPQLQPMTMDPDPLFEPRDQEWAFDSARVLNGGTVLVDDGRFRMWYGAVPRHPDQSLPWYMSVPVGYAESTDGVIWTRPDVGLGATYAGQPAPNYIPALDHNACVYVDPEDSPGRRYKAVKFLTRASYQDEMEATDHRGYLQHPRGVLVRTSDDGIHWRQGTTGTITFHGAIPYGFTAQKAFHDPRDPDPNRRYKAIGFASLVARRRVAMLATSPDGLTWEISARTPELDSMAAATPIRPLGPYAQIHDATMTRIGPYLLALYQHQFDGNSADLRLAVSRDNARFHFVQPEAPLVPLGPGGGWYDNYLMPADFVDTGDRLALYLGACSNTRRHDHVGLPPWRCVAARATIRRDGFVALRLTGTTPGQLITIPFPAVADPLSLTVNAELGHGSCLRAAVYPGGELARPLPGFDYADCRPITGDSLAHPIAWSAAARLPAGTDFRLGFRLQGSSADALYAASLHA